MLPAHAAPRLMLCLWQRACQPRLDQEGQQLRLPELTGAWLKGWTVRNFQRLRAHCKTAGNVQTQTGGHSGTPRFQNQNVPAACMKVAAFALPKGEDLMGPVAVVSVIYLFVFRSSPCLSSALRHRDNEPCSLRFSGSYLSQFPSEFSWWRLLEGGGRTEVRESPGCLFPSLFDWGGPSRNSCVPSVAPPPQDSLISWVQLQRGSPWCGSAPSTWP